MNFEALVENISWASVDGETTMDRHGRDVAVVVAKMAYKVSREGAPRLALAPVRRVDEGDGGGGVRFPADLVADEKPGTDVGLVGIAYPPPRSAGIKGRVYAWLQVGTLRKVVVVHGPRVYVKNWRGAVAPSDPAPFVEPVPLRFDKCYGGMDHISGAFEPANPIGMGFSSQPTRLLGEPAPPLEPASIEEGGAPCHASYGAFSPIPAHWEPRRSRIGTHDAAWAKSRAPVRPRDFDPMHHAWSVPGLYSGAPLLGDEPVEVGGVLPDGVWRFRLPRYAVQFGSQIDGKKVAYETHLDGFLIDTETRAVELTWRASIVLPRKWERLERIYVLGVGTLPEDVIRDPGRSVGAGRAADPAHARSV
ncbi:DUF2169 domain-containing protein [Polyangium sp. y55x31]|uniref:DUF2169 family type VI secretion system accessory protein n=1 Tax=Polyangium sp. y55x31 TaxID=3042688 RepID=UPI0024830137|nr:DUF2169 domain-containing protein [Polyangium sp. y55x31]MDI1481002.1 DUF2169 domain-containing protein [Polyangium sp. y55x31]